MLRQKQAAYRKRKLVQLLARVYCSLCTFFFFFSIIIIIIVVDDVVIVFFVLLLLLIVMIVVTIIETPLDLLKQQR